MSDTKRVVRAIGAGGVHKRIIIQGDLAVDQSVEQVKEGIYADLNLIKRMVLADRNDMLMASMSEARKACDAGDSATVVPDIFSDLADRLWGKWMASGVELPWASLHRGHCGVERHSWFQVGAPSELIHEYRYTFILDPYARGAILMNVTDSLAESDFLLIQPWSPFQGLYVGEQISPTYSRGEL